MRALPASLLSLILVVSSGCGSTSTGFPSTCTLPTPTAESAALPGAAVWITASSMSSVNDTVVTVGSEQAAVLAVERSSCESCDTCRDTNACSVCGDCDSCATDCATCVERVRVTVPEGASPGTQALTVRNAYGTSVPGTIEVLGTDTQAVDTGDSAP
jgi:hypothetical protein